uniref:Uncharacterized protein n=1 Tax=mine drainage metagenome TaxID=410659 RepID=E6Q7R9_9ZZZZ
MLTLNFHLAPWVNVILALALNILVVVACFSVRRGKIAFGTLAVCSFTVLEFQAGQSVPQFVIALFEVLGTVAGVVFLVQHFRGKLQRQDSGK